MVDGHIGTVTEDELAVQNLAKYYNTHLQYLQYNICALEVGTLWKIDLYIATCTLISGTALGKSKF